MSLMSRFFGGGAPLRALPPLPLDRKTSRTAGLVAHFALGLARWTPRNTTELTRQGYERNPVVYRAVRMIVEAASSVPWLAYADGAETPAHPALDLLAHPNPADSGPSFVESVLTNLLLFGNAYVEAVRVDGVARELYNLRPDRMSIVPGPSGWPAAFEYQVGAERVRFAVKAGEPSPILHLRLFHPLDDHYGFAPLSAAQGPLDIHNAAGAWNKALLDNAARPSGALVYTGPDGATLSSDQFERLKAELDENFSGARNAGRPLLLEGGLDWKALSLSPRDMDFIDAKAAAARDIALAFGIPPLVLGLPGDNTFSNYQEANRVFWRQTIVPLLQRTQAAFAAGLASDFGPFTLRPNLDGVDALASERETEWRRIGAATFLTDDEKREAVGYGPRQP